MRFWKVAVEAKTVVARWSWRAVVFLSMSLASGIRVIAVIEVKSGALSTEGGLILGGSAMMVGQGLRLLELGGCGCVTGIEEEKYLNQGISGSNLYY